MIVNRFNGLVLFLALALNLGTESAHALPLPKGELTPQAFAELLPAGAGTVDFTAIVALNNCSGSLVRFESSLETDRAMILTNGHCIGGLGFLKPGEVKYNTWAMRSFKLLSSDGKKALGTLNADRLLYATMTSTDMALYSLKQTYGDIEKKYKVRALTLSPKHPAAGRKIAVASGYWKRIYTCAIDGFVHGMREADWTFKDSIRYTNPGCETIGGTSGSPIIDAETYEVIGVNNTANESGQKCTMNNPCEVDEGGNVTVRHPGSYGQQTYWVYSCLNTKNEIDLAKPGCELPKPAARRW